jgi:hypothetical protein
MGISTWLTGGLSRRTRSFPLAGRWLPAGAVLTGLALLSAASPASAQTQTWSTVPSPNPSPSVNSLNAVSCVSATACTAVGFTIKKGGPSAPRQTLIESWNGTRWSVVTSPDPGRVNVLQGVSCASAASCTAAGYYAKRGGPDNTLIESWNGTSWSVVPSPNPTKLVNIFSGVSCASAASCTAVGYSRGRRATIEKTLIESWNGTSWSAIPSPNPSRTFNTLGGVSCVSASACTAVGGWNGPAGHGRTLIESWNGTKWSAVASPDPAPYDGLDNVSCVSANACTAVGNSTQTTTGTAASTLIESWNGTSWSVVPSPNGETVSRLDGVSCVSATACTATGYQDGPSPEPSTLVESWDGTSWSVVASPSPGITSSLGGVSCVKADTCTAAGTYLNARSLTKTLIEAAA